MGKWLLEGSRNPYAQINQWTFKKMVTGVNRNSYGKVALNQGLIALGMEKNISFFHNYRPSLCLSIPSPSF